MLWLMLSAMGRAYITARLVEILVHSNPDWREFKSRMDSLNRYIIFNRLPPELSIRLREVRARRLDPCTIRARTAPDLTFRPPAVYSSSTSRATRGRLRSGGKSCSS